MTRGNPVKRINIKSSLKKYKNITSFLEKYINKVVHNKKASVKPVSNIDDCGQFKMRWNPKCKDQSNCKWKRGEGGIKKPKKSFKI